MISVHFKGKPFQYTSEEYWEEPYEQYEQAKDMTLKDELPRSIGAQYTTGEEWGYSSRKKRLSQTKNNAQVWMWLVMDVKLKAVKNNITKEPGMLGPWIKVNWE